MPRPKPVGEIATLCGRFAKVIRFPVDLADATPKDTGKRQ
jgi:hypothetical protein